MLVVVLCHLIKQFIFEGINEMNEKLQIIENALKELGFSTERDFLPVVLDKYVSMGGRFSYCGATNAKMHLELDDEFQMLDNIAYSLGLEFVGVKS